MAMARKRMICFFMCRLVEWKDCLACVLSIDQVNFNDVQSQFLFDCFEREK